MTSRLSEQNLAAPNTASAIRPSHVLILGGLSALGALSTDMYLPALPTLTQELGSTMSQAQLTLSAGILGLLLGQIVSVPSSGVYGRRRPLLIGIAAYALPSLLCLVARSMTVLTIFRFIQGVVGAAGITIALVIASDLYSGTTQARFLSLLMQVTGVAPIAAPIIGSQLLRFISWQGIFVTLALIGATLWLAVAFGLRETLPVERRQAGGIGATLSAFRTLLGDRHFLGYALACGFAFAACIIYISDSPFVLQNIYGLSPQVFGIVFGINAMGIVVLAQVNSRLVARIAPRTLLTWGITAFVVACILLPIVVLVNIGLFGLLPLFFVLVSSLGMIVPNATTLALANTRAAESASALLGVLQFSVGAIVAPLVGLGGSTSAMPMTSAMAFFGIITASTFVVLCRRD